MVVPVNRVYFLVLAPGVVVEAEVVVGVEVVIGPVRVVGMKACNIHKKTCALRAT